MDKIKQSDALSTSFVNLAALIRHLRSERFVGAIHVALEHYEAEVVMSAEGTETVSEIDPVTGRVSQTEGAMERLLVHAREPGGIITVHEDNTFGDQTESASDAAVSRDQAPASSSLNLEPPLAAVPEVVVDWDELIDASSALVSAVERAVQNMGAEFESTFRTTRIEMGDDYPFLDPSSNGLTYADKIVTFTAQARSSVFVTGLSECLRRTVNKLATGKEQKRFRETVAVELAVATRTRPNGLAQFTSHLDKIAGTRVL